MKVKRKIIEIDEDRCDGCGQCVPSCAEGAIEIVDGKARIVAEKYCDGLGACLGECPNDALHIVEREAEDFDEEAVEEHLKNRPEEPDMRSVAAGCPSAGLKTFHVPASRRQTHGTAVGSDGPSLLSHWPIQIHLIPPTAPFLKGADLLIAADCTAVAYPAFHQEMLKGKVVMLGCPKFDDVEAYIQKFTDIFRTADIKSITAVHMEVPCCSALPVIIRKAMAASGKRIPMEEIIVRPTGEMLKPQKEQENEKAQPV